MAAVSQDVSEKRFYSGSEMFKKLAWSEKRGTLSITGIAGLRRSMRDVAGNWAAGGMLNLDGLGVLHPISSLLKTSIEIEVRRANDACQRGNEPLPES